MSSEWLPPLSAVPPTNKKTHPPISKPHPATKNFFFHHAFLMCNCFCFSATATSTLHCRMFPHPPPRDVFGPSVTFQDAKTEKKHHLPNDRFLIKILLKNDVFGSSERLPYLPWARSPPQIKRRTPQLVNPTQPRRVFFHRAFLMCKCFVFLQQLHQHCIAWCFFIHLPGVCLVHLLNFKTPKPKKKHHLPNDGFLIKIFIEKWCFLSSERLPPLSAVPPTNKKTHPPISKPHPATKNFFHHAFLMCNCFCVSATATSTLHCLMFPHPPPRDVFGPSV